MLFAAKIAEIDQHLEYLRATYSWLRAEAYPNLDARLRLRLDGIEEIAREAADVATDFSGYQPAANPALDTWPQIFARLHLLAGKVHALRTVDLPAHLAGSPDERQFAAVFETLHREVGLTDVHPVVSLQQHGWFAVIKDLPTHPLYLAPDSLIRDQGELPLVFHEIGHVLFQHWAPDFPNQALAVLNNTLQRKVREMQAVSDQGVRDDMLAALKAWATLVPAQVEEMVCDTVGALLGGPSFAAALAVGLSMTDTRPFDYLQSGNYPPLDCRLRICGVVLRRRGLADSRLLGIEDGWARVCTMPGTQAPRFYKWLYDDAVLGDLAEAVEAVLVAKGVQIYQAGCGGLREQLEAGATARLTDDAAYRAWSASFAAALPRDYALPQSSSSSSSSGSSA